MIKSVGDMIWGNIMECPKCGFKFSDLHAARIVVKGSCMTCQVQEKLMRKEEYED